MEKVLIAVLILFSLAFLGLQLYQFEIAASGVRALLVLLLCILYCTQVAHKRLYFFLFLITFTASEILGFVSWFIPLYEGQVDIYYYIGNGLYIVSYLFLIIQLLKSMNIREVFFKLPFHFIILFILDVFCVSIVTGTTRPELNIYEYSLEFVYNGVIMVLLSLALINYIFRDDKKSMNFLLASIFIVFSEVIQLAYFYVSPDNLLNVLCSLFIVFAFVFFYIQSTLRHKEKIDFQTID